MEEQKAVAGGSMKNKDTSTPFSSCRFHQFAWRSRKCCLIAAFILLMFLCILLTDVMNSVFFDHQSKSQLNPIPGTQIPSEFYDVACPASRANNSISPIYGTRYVMVSAFINEESNGQARIITIMNRTYSEPFICIFCCEKRELSVSPVILEKHSDNFGFPFVTTDAICSIKPTCKATHVTISRTKDILKIQNHLYLPIHRTPRQGKDFNVDFTLCISSMFGNYNNVLQFVQTIETYKLLGVQKVIVYNNSCGPDLEKVLNSYKEDRLLEIIPWPIHHFLKPSKGWKYELHPGEVHYYGQQATLNDCIHRNRQRSRYLLLNDVDEIIMPYKHSTLLQLMTELQKSHPYAATFLFKENLFSTSETSGGNIFDLPLWRNIPGVNILRHIYREPLNFDIYLPTKMIIDPRKVTQTSIHEVLVSSGETVYVPNDLALVRHTTTPWMNLGTDKLIKDKMIWKYAERLIPNVNKVLQKAGLLNSTWQKS